MNNLISTQEDAEAAIVSRDRRRSLSIAAHERLKQTLLSDSYLFAKRICKHADLVDSIHMPLSYLVCGLTDRLIETLEMKQLDSYVTRKLRHELWRRKIDWRTAEGRAELDRRINGSLVHPAILNIRMFRRLFKSSVITHAGTLFIATRDPNETIKITHAVDPKAWEFCEQIGRTVDSGTYRDFFPERIPDGDFTKLVTMRRIELGGRTISHPQTTIQASGVNTKEEAAHYSTFVTDDLVTDLNSTPDQLVEVMKWYRRLTGYYMPTRPIRRIEVGTKHDEDDDDTFLTTGKMAEECLTLRVPIMEYDHPVANVLELGKPTCPEIFPLEKIKAEQAHVLSGESDEDGYRAWWNQYLLSATGGTLRLFPAEIVDDPDRWWLGPFNHPKPEWAKRGHFLVGKYKRDSEGMPIARQGEKIYDSDGKLIENWRDYAEIVATDPWQEMDRVILVDPSWGESSGSDNWAVSVVGQDVDVTSFQLQTQSDTTGIDGWTSALLYLDEIWHPRIWGIDATAAQDPMIENLLRTDRRLRRLTSRMVKIHHQTNKSKGSRMREGLAEPLKAYRFLLAPAFRDSSGEDRFGGNMTRDELKSIRSTPKHAVRTDQDGIADSLAMAPAVIRTARRVASVSTYQPRRKVDPILGVPIQGAT